MSKIPEGFLSGHMNSYGDFDECLATRGEVSASGIVSNFKGQYCRASLAPEHICQPAEVGVTTEQYQIAGPIFDLGVYPGVALCVPSKCSQNDIQAFLKAATNSTGVCISLA